MTKKQWLVGGTILLMGWAGVHLYHQFQFNKDRKASLPFLKTTLVGHPGWVESVAISSDSQTLVSADNSQTIKAWNLNTGQLIRTITTPSDIFYAVAISPDGQTLVTGSSSTDSNDDKTDSDQAIKIWNLHTGQLIRQVDHNSAPVESVVISPNGRLFASGNLDGEIDVWDLATGKLIRHLSGHTDWVRCVAISPDSQTLVSGSNDGKIKVWDLNSGELIHSFIGHSNSWLGYFIEFLGLFSRHQSSPPRVVSVAISPDGKTIVSSSQGQEIDQWNLSTGSLVRRIPKQSDWVNSVAIAPNGKTVIGGHDDGKVRLWNLDTGELERTLTDHRDWVNTVAISPNGKTIVSGSSDRTIKVWQVSPN